VRRLLLAIVFAFLLTLPEASADEAAQIYQPGVVLEIDLGLSAQAETELKAEPDKDVKGTFTARLTDGTPGGSTNPLTTDHPVEVHLKGHIGGSFRPLAAKAALKLKFKKTELFLGLRKMTLNNMVEDTSMLHETLAYSLFGPPGSPLREPGSPTCGSTARTSGSIWILRISTKPLSPGSTEPATRFTSTRGNTAPTPTLMVSPLLTLSSPKVNRGSRWTKVKGLQPTSKRWRARSPPAHRASPAVSPTSRTSPR
jgi:CotH kinase protein